MASVVFEAPATWDKAPTFSPRDPLYPLCHESLEAPSSRSLRLHAMQKNFAAGLSALAQVEDGGLGDLVALPAVDKQEVVFTFDKQVEDRALLLVIAAANIFMKAQASRVTQTFSARLISKEAAFQIQTLLNQPQEDRLALGVQLAVAAMCVVLIPKEPVEARRLVIKTSELSIQLDHLRQPSERFADASNTFINN